MNCIDCRYSLIKDGHSKCTYEEGECIKISVLEKENAELREDLRNKKLAIQNRNGRIKELEEKISVLLSCKNCPDNKGGLVCQKEYEDKCLTQKIQFIKELQEEIAELKDDNKVMADNYSKMEQKFSDNLTKVKELLKWFVWYFREGSSNLVPYRHKVVEAEQFLNSEVSE